MSDIFSQKDAQNLLEGKKIILIGDSILRSIYQDLLCLLETGEMTNELDLKKKGAGIYIQTKYFKINPSFCEEFYPFKGEHGYNIIPHI